MSQSLAQTVQLLMLLFGSIYLYGKTESSRHLDTTPPPLYAQHATMEGGGSVGSR